MAVNAISVSLAESAVTVQQDGPPVDVLITIDSPSETALVSVTGLPAGVGVKYAASDTNPSGTLTFSASEDAAAGTYAATVTAMSASQTASAKFALIVTAAKAG